MKLDKIQYISFKSAEEAVQVAKFLVTLGFKVDKNCFKLETYIYDMPFTFSPTFPGAKRGDLVYNGFSKYSLSPRFGYGWKVTHNDGSIFTFKVRGTSFIRCEKLNRLNNL